MVWTCMFEGNVQVSAMLINKMQCILHIYTHNTAYILHLFLTNHPDMINKHVVIPGLSDYDISPLDIKTGNHQEEIHL